MTAKEAIEVLEKPSTHIHVVHKAENGMEFLTYSADLVKAFEMAIKALEKQDAIERIIERLEEMKLVRVEQCHEDYELEVMTESNFDDAIQIIKEEVG